MKTPARIEVQRFATAELAPEDRFDAWVSRASAQVAPAFEMAPLEEFSAVTETFQLGEVLIQHVELSAMRWRRDRAMLRSWAADSLVVALRHRGAGHGVMGDKSFRTGPGSILLCDLAQTSMHDTTLSRATILLVPRPVATKRGLDVAALHGTVLTSAISAMLAPNVLAARDAAPHLNVEEGAVVGQAILDLLVLAVQSDSNAAMQTLRHGSLAWAVRQEVERQLGSHLLTVGNLSRRLHVSRSTLHRLFEPEGGLGAYIRGRRLEAARRALLDPAGNETLGTLAERFGFSDGAHLSRLFRAKFDITPSDLRARAREDRPA